MSKIFVRAVCNFEKWIEVPDGLSDLEGAKYAIEIAEKQNFLSKSWKRNWVGLEAGREIPPRVAGKMIKR